MIFFAKSELKIGAKSTVWRKCSVHLSVRTQYTTSAYWDQQLELKTINGNVPSSWETIRIKTCKTNSIDAQRLFDCLDMNETVHSENKRRSKAKKAHHTASPRLLKISKIRTKLGSSAIQIDFFQWWRSRQESITEVKQARVRCCWEGDATGGWQLVVDVQVEFSVKETGVRD